MFLIVIYRGVEMYGVMENLRLNMRKVGSVSLLFFLSYVCLSTVIFNKSVEASELNLPATDKLLDISDVHSKPVMKGLRFDPENPRNLQFVFDSANMDNVNKETASRLINYFIAGLTIPEEDLWVNLSPYEQDRIVDDGLVKTDLGRDMLSQDYVLKQFSSSLFNPDGSTGKNYWETLRKRLLQVSNEVALPTDVFNKVWVVPEKADMVEDEDGAGVLILKSSLDVMLEEDYLAVESNLDEVTLAKAPNDLSKTVMRDKVLPVIKNEINYGENFSTLRQIYNSLLVATWFKKKFAQTFYNNYFNSKTIEGIEIKDSKEEIYKSYVEAYKKGALNVSKKERDINSGKLVKRHYFSGGENFQRLSSSVNILPQVSWTVKKAAFVGLAFVANVALTFGQDNVAVREADNPGYVIERVNNLEQEIEAVVDSLWAKGNEFEMYFVGKNFQHRRAYISEMVSSAKTTKNLVEELVAKEKMSVSDLRKYYNSKLEEFEFITEVANSLSEDITFDMYFFGHYFSTRMAYKSLLISSAKTDHMRVYEYCRDNNISVKKLKSIYEKKLEDHRMIKAVEDALLKGRIWTQAKYFGYSDVNDFSNQNKSVYVMLLELMIDEKLTPEDLNKRLEKTTGMRIRLTHNVGGVSMRSLGSAIVPFSNELITRAAKIVEDFSSINVSISALERMND